jgi:peptidoglycan/xylan/chitin deacetylase (PgdA/CDA1 family)
MSDTLVLCHQAASEDLPTALAIAPDRFRDHVRCLVRRGYRGVTFSEAALGTGEHDAVAITLDDACRSVLDLAFPILSEEDFPATVFASTAFIGNSEPMVWPGLDQWQGGEHADELLPCRGQSCRRWRREAGRCVAHPHASQPAELGDGGGGRGTAWVASGRRRPSGTAMPLLGLSLRLPRRPRH